MKLALPIRLLFGVGTLLGLFFLYALPLPAYIREQNAMTFDLLTDALAPLFVLYGTTVITILALMGILQGRKKKCLNSIRNYSVIFGIHGLVLLITIWLFW